MGRLGYITTKRQGYRRAMVPLGTLLNLPYGTYLITEEGEFLIEEDNVNNFIVTEYQKTNFYISN